MVINDARQLYVPFLYPKFRGLYRECLVHRTSDRLRHRVSRLFYLIFIFFYRVIFQNYYVLDETERMDLSLLRYIYDLIGLRSKWIFIDRSNRRYRRCMQVHPFLETNCRSGIPWPDGNRVSMRRTVRSIVLLRRLAG